MGSGDVLNLKAIPDEGSVFVGWLVDGAPYQGIFRMSGNTVLTAIFEEIPNEPPVAEEDAYSTDEDTVLSVPTAYRESKGFFVLEALAAGVPVVQPDHGSFPELIEQTGGGVLYEAGNAEALADTLGGLMADAPLRSQLAARGQAAVRRDFSVEAMATAAWALYKRFG